MPMRRKEMFDLLRTVNHAVTVMLTVEEEGNFKDSFRSSMGPIGLCIDVDRVQIWQNETIDGELYFVIKYEWVSDTGLQKAPVPIGLKFPYSTVPEWKEKFSRGEYINSPLSNLPQNDQDFLASYDIKSIVIIPLILRGQFWGFFSADDCRNERAFTEDEIDILRSASLMIASKLSRDEQAGRLRDAHNQMRLLIEAMPFSCNLWDKNLNLFECNEGTVGMFGISDKRDFLEHFEEFSPEYQPDGGLSAEKTGFYLKKAFDEGRCVFEWMHQKRDGTPIPAEVTLVRVNHDGDHAVAGYARDLREQKRMISEIERGANLLNTVNQVANILLQSESHEFEEKLQQCMSMIGGVVRANRVCIWKNKTMEGRLYCSLIYEWVDEDRLRTNPGIATDVPYEGNIPTWEELLPQGKCINSLTRDLSPTERARMTMHGILSIFAAPVFVHDEFWGFVGFDDCHNEKVFTEDEASTLYSGSLLIANALVRNEMMLNIQSANNAKSDFLAKISHEMRTPLNAVIGLSELALEDEAIKHETRLNIEKVNNAGTILLNTVNDILDISKIEAGKLELVEVEYDIPSFLNDTITQNIIHIGEKPIEFVLDIDENLPTLLYGDDLRVKQIFNNILSNAFKYTREGIVELGVRCDRYGETVCMTAWIHDTGIGIKPEEISTLFEEFTQIDTQANRNIQGTGLGLSIAKRMAELMGGTITVESEYGKGSTFTIKLRQKFVTDTKIGAEVVENLKTLRYYDEKRRANSKRVWINLSYARVLVVDDNLTNLDVARGLMKPYGMQIDCVTGGQQAIHAIREESVKYNAIFMDHMMPGMDGMEATRLIREIGTDYAKNIPVIACTANAIIGNEQVFLNNGFQAFISKPIEVARLDEVIRHWVRDKDFEKTLAAELFDGPLDLQNTPDMHVISCHRSGIDRRKVKMRFAGLDIDKGIERFGGNRESYFQILNSYIVHTRPLLDSIKSVTEDKLADYAITVHGIKGSSRGISADMVGSAAESLEKAAKAGDFAYVSSHNQTFLDAVWKLVFDIEDMLSNINTGNPKPKKDKPEEEILSKLLNACKSYNMDEVDEAMVEMEKYQYETDDGLADWLIDNIKLMNFKQIVDKLSTGGSENE